MKKMLIEKALAVFVALAVLFPAAAFAQCETPFSANPPMLTLATVDTTNINTFITQEENFINGDLTQTATYEMMARLTEFNNNLLSWLNGWSPQFVAALKAMTMQLSIAQVQQTSNIGAMMDAQLVNETVNNKAMKQAEAARRYAPSEMSCQMDTAGAAETKAAQVARALSRGLALDDEQRRGNAIGSVSAAGTGAEINSDFQEYVTYFCDNTKGDQGCSQPGTLAGRHKDIPGLLWGDRQTVDLSNLDNIRMIQASLRYLIYPLAPDPVPPSAVPSSDGHQEILARRAEAARVNAIYSAVGQMVGERAGGSGANPQTFTQALRSAAGIPPSISSVSPSYSEIRGAMAGDRFLTPEYIVDMVGDPAQAVREQGTINAIRLQMLNDIYHRSEEMMLLTAADYSRDLDKEIPSSAVAAAPLK